VAGWCHATAAPLIPSSRPTNPIKSTDGISPARLILMEDGQRRRSLRAGFDQTAEDFDRTRSVCCLPLSCLPLA
jgi:hypothetical protein